MENITPLVFGFLQLLAALLVLGLATERGTQLVKEFLRAIGEKVPFLNFADRRSFFLAAVIAFFVTFFFKVDPTQYLQLLDGYDPELVKIVNSLLLMFVSNGLHDKFFKAGY